MEWSPVACSWLARYPSYQMHWRNEAEESGQVVELQDWACLAAVGLCVYIMFVVCNYHLNAVLKLKSTVDLYSVMFTTLLHIKTGHELTDMYCQL